MAVFASIFGPDDRIWKHARVFSEWDPPIMWPFQMNGSLMLNQGVFRGRAEYHLEGGDFVSPLKTAILCFQMQFIDPTSAGLAGILWNCFSEFSLCIISTRDWHDFMWIAILYFLKILTRLLVQPKAFSLCTHMVVEEWVFIYRKQLLCASAYILFTQSFVINFVFCAGDWSLQPILTEKLVFHLHFITCQNLHFLIG